MSTAVEASGSSSRRAIVLVALIAAAITSATITLLFAYAHEGDPKPRRPAEVPVVEPDRDTGLPACDQYVAAMERYLQCDKVPQAARDGSGQGMAAMKSNWDDTRNMPADARRAANDACRQALDALTQGAAAIGCSRVRSP